MDVLGSLANAGLNKNEAKVYLALLQVSDSMARALSYKTNLHRANVYDALYSLITKGLASYSIQNEKKHFKAKPPESIIEYLKNKQEEINKIIPEIKKISALKEKKEEVYLSEGILALKDALKNLINGEEVFVYGIPETDDRIIAFMKDLYREMGKLKIKIKCLYTKKDEEWNKEIKKIKNMEIRHLEREQERVIKFIFNNKTIIVVLEKEPLIIEIENEKITNFHKEEFGILWNIAKEV